MPVPGKARVGDRVAVLSPSWAGPGVFPAVFELGLARLRDVLELTPVEFATTRLVGATPEQRARDIEAAFADPSISAIIASIGGSDQIKVLRHLDPAILRANPKPFLGYSDNTNLLLYLWNLGVVGYYGGSVMVQLGRPGRLHPATEASLRLALFDSGPVQLAPVAEFTDADGHWDDPSTFDREPAMAPTDPWWWHGPQSVVSGRTWGGCLEIVDMHLRSGHHLLAPEAYADAVLLVETSEEMPEDEYVYRVLMGMGERGMLEQFGAVLVARPKSLSHERQWDQERRRRYVDDQRAAVLRALSEYNPSAPVVFGLDFGHSEPQVVMPYGSVATVDALNRTVTVSY